MNLDDLTVDVVGIRTIKHHPQNPRKGNVDLICESLKAHGQYRPLVVQKSTRFVLAGNHTLRAARRLGWKKVAVSFVDVDDEQAKKIVLVDNRSNDTAEYDNGALVELLASLSNLTGTGYEQADIDALLAEPDDAEGFIGEGTAKTDGKERGTSVDLLDVAMAEPEHVVTEGQVWKLGRHVLYVGSVQHGWPVWAPHLIGDAVFAPYPTPMVPVLFDEAPLVMVQPDTYMAGHLLDKFASKFGEPELIT